MRKLPKKITLDISGYDRSTIIWEIRSAYVLGYDEITVVFKNEETPHLRKAGRVFVRDVVSYTASRMLGVKTTFPTPKSCILNIPEAEKQSNVQEMTRRISKMIVEMHGELLLLMKGHIYAASLIEEKHDSISKLVSLVKRHINTGKATGASIAQYHILCTLDKIADIIKYISRDYIKAQYPLSKTAYMLFEYHHQCIVLFDNALNKPHQKEILAFSLKRDDVKRFMRESISSLPVKETFLLGQATVITEILIDIMESRMAVKNAP